MVFVIYCRVQCDECWADLLVQKILLWTFQASEFFFPWSLRENLCRDSAQSEIPGILSFVSSPQRKTPIEKYSFMCKAEILGRSKSKGYPCTLPQAYSERIPNLTSESQIYYLGTEKEMAEGQLLEDEIQKYPVSRL